jgi:uncharacterized protein (TIGR03067 family)
MAMNRLLGLLVVALIPTVATTAPVPAAPKEDAKTQLARLVGTWEVTSYLKGGEEQIGPTRKMVLTFKADGSYAFASGSKGRIAAIDPTKEPKEIDYVQFDRDGDEVTGDDGKPLLEKGIYKLEGDTFTDCFGQSGEKERPKEFKSTKENGWTRVTYKRLKKID